MWEVWGLDSSLAGTTGLQALSRQKVSTASCTFVRHAHTCGVPVWGLST